MNSQWKTILYCVLVVLQNTSAINHHSDPCSLLPSELGPDWYKVPQPEPAGDLTSYDPSFIHMPCAPATVFDVAVCGCTNLMSFIFTSLSRGQQHISHEKALGKVAPRDFVKLVDNSSTPTPPVGSLLINTKTGEVKHCPFRASNRGVQWYMIREPRDRWRSMKCAAGTLFDKRQCTCVHRLLDLREPTEIDGENIVILEEDFSRTDSDNMISQSLGISAADIDFAPKKQDEDIPFWRRQDLFESKDMKEEPKSFRGTSDVTVMLHNDKLEEHSEPKNPIELGRDVVSEVHKELFLKDRKEPISIAAKTKAVPLVLDRTLKSSLDLSNDLHAHTIDSLIIDVTKISTKKPETITTLKDSSNTTVQGIVNNTTRAPVRAIVAGSGKEDGGDNIRETNITDSKSGIDAEVVFHNADCRKRPLPELGPQFFLMFVLDLGYIPFSCHGNSVYDESTCTCTPASGSTNFDEMPFPEKDCTKRALPKFGPHFFEDFLHNFGFVPYACHGNTIFNEIKCNCE